MRGLGARKPDTYRVLRDGIEARDDQGEFG